MGIRLDYGVTTEEAELFINKDDAARVFMAKYKGRTKGEYSRCLCTFFKWLQIKKGIQITPSEFLNKQLKYGGSERVEERKWAKNLALEFCRDNPDFEDHSDIHGRLIWNVINQFFRSHEVPFSSEKNPLGTKAGKRKYRSQPMNRDDLKKILAVLNVRDKAITLCMIQSGMGVKETLQKFNFMLSYVQSQIKAGAERIRIDLDNRKGNNANYFTYISRDAIQALRKWLMDREKLLQENELVLSSDAEKAIFITENGTLYNIAQFEKNYEYHLYKNNIKTQPFQYIPHDLRKFFKTESSPPDRGIDSRFVEFMIGHKGGIEDVGGTYDNSPFIHDRAVQKEYEKLEPYINIYSGIAEKEATIASAELENINDKLKQKDQEMQELKKEMQELTKSAYAMKELTEYMAENMQFKEGLSPKLGVLIGFMKMQAAKQQIEENLSRETNEKEE